MFDSMRSVEGGLRSSMPSTFKGDRGGTAEDEELLREFRAISMKSSTGTTVVDMVVAAPPPPGGVAVPEPAMDSSTVNAKGKQGDDGDAAGLSKSIPLQSHMLTSKLKQQQPMRQTQSSGAGLVWKPKSGNLLQNHTLTQPQNLSSRRHEITGQQKPKQHHTIIASMRRTQSTTASTSSCAGMLWKPTPSEKVSSEKDPQSFRTSQRTADPTVDAISAPSITSTCSGSRTNFSQSTPNETGQPELAGTHDMCSSPSMKQIDAIAGDAIANLLRKHMLHKRQTSVDIMEKAAKGNQGGGAAAGPSQSTLLQSHMLARPENHSLQLQKKTKQNMRRGSSSGSGLVWRPSMSSMLSLESCWEGDEADARNGRKVPIRPNHTPMHHWRSGNETLTSSMRPARYSGDNLAGSFKSMTSLRNQPRRANKSTASMLSLLSVSSERPSQQEMNDGAQLNNEEWGLVTDAVHEAPLLEQKIERVPSRVNFEELMEVHSFACPSHKVTTLPTLEPTYRRTITNEMLEHEDWWQVAPLEQTQVIPAKNKPDEPSSFQVLNDIMRDRQRSIDDNGSKSQTEPSSLSTCYTGSYKQGDTSVSTWESWEDMY